MKKLAIILCVFVAGGYLFWITYLWTWFSCGIAGSMPCAENRFINLSPNKLILLVDSIKKEHPDLVPPHDADYREISRDQWRDFTFYYNDTNEDVYITAWASPDSLYCILSFVAIATHFDADTPIKDAKMDRREINRDFTYFENKRQIKKFEQKIYKLIDERIK